MSTMILDENDYLNYTLYTLSKSEKVSKERMRIWISVTVISCALSYVLFDMNHPTAAYLLLGAGAITVLFFWFFYARIVRHHYAQFIRENYKTKFGDAYTVEINDACILTKNKSGESRMPIADIVEINEIEAYYFIKLTTGASLIIPKPKLSDPEIIRQQIDTLISLQGLKHNVEPDWRWNRF